MTSAEKFARNTCSHSLFSKNVFFPTSFWCGHESICTLYCVLLQCGVHGCGWRQFNPLFWLPTSENRSIWIKQRLDASSNKPAADTFLTLAWLLNVDPEIVLTPLGHRGLLTIYCGEAGLLLPWCGAARCLGVRTQRCRAREIWH